MVVLVDLSDDGDALDPPADPRQSHFHQVALRQRTSQPLAPALVDRPNPNLTGFAAALAGYPIATQIVRSLDLNDLHALSRTCRQIHGNLRQFRASLIACTLRCVNEAPDRLPADLAALRTQDPARSIRARLTSGRVGPCAHDLVGPCQRCGDAVCRNCVARVPTSRLPQRLRRLCTACLQAPLAALTGRDVLAPGPAAASPRSDGGPEVPGAPAVEGSPGAPGTPGHEDRGDAGYLRQEVEGIGGVVRGKVKKRIRMGCPVREFEDERERAVFLEREVHGERRSWCGWCDRVIPARSDDRL